MNDKATIYIREHGGSLSVLAFLTVYLLRPKAFERENIVDTARPDGDNSIYIFLCPSFN